MIKSNSKKCNFIDICSLSHCAKSLNSDVYTFIRIESENWIHNRLEQNSHLSIIELLKEKDKMLLIETSNK